MPKGTPRIGSPRDPHDIEQAEIAAEVERKEDALDDAALSGDYVPKHIELSPEGKAQEESEKAQLLADLKSTRPARPAPERGAPESLSRHPIIDVGGHAPERHVEEPAPIEEPEVVPAPVLSAEEQALALTELELLDQELAALDAERKAVEGANAQELKRIKLDTDTALALVNKKREELAAKQKDAREAAARVELADRARAAQQEARQNRQREQSGLDVQRAAFAETFQPVLDNAKRVLKQIAALNKESGTALRELGSLKGFDDTPSSWPTELRLKFRDRVIRPAREVVRLMDNTLRDDLPEGPSDNIRQGERLLRTWTPGTHSATLRQLLSYTNDDLVRGIRDQITTINEQSTVIEAQGQEYIRSGETPPEVVVLLNEGIRQDLKQRIVSKHLRSGQQTHATGISAADPIDPTKTL